jgi:hypothetical protein
MHMIYNPIKTLQDFNGKIQFNKTTESIYWDFKSQLDYNLPENTAIDMAAFANSEGGTLLVGIAESLNEQGLKVARGINPNINLEKTKGYLSDPVLKKIKPRIQFDPVAITFENGNSIVAVNIEPSINLLGVCLNSDRNSFCFPYRKNHENKFYEFHELEERVQNNHNRAKYLKVLSLIPNAEVPIPVEIYPFPRGADENDNIQIKVLKESENVFEVIINSWVIHLPYSMIDEIWNRANVGCKLVLKLNEKLYKHDNGIDFDYPEIRRRHEKPGVFII